MPEMQKEVKMEIQLQVEALLLPSGNIIDQVDREICSSEQPNY